MELQTLEQEALKELEQVQSLSEIETLYVKYLGRKEGQLTKVLRNLGSLSPDEKKKTGQAANQLKQLIEGKIGEIKTRLQAAHHDKQIHENKIDVTLPGTPILSGRSHPILQNIKIITDIFKQLGFDVVEGPEIETDRNNFTDLNIAENHAARDLHDTFYLDPKNIKLEDPSSGPLLLRTHTSPVQIRLMKKVKPPVRIVAPGRVYRHEAVDATHAAVFHQIEGLAVDEGITFADLKGTLTHFARKFFGEDTPVRFRPSYFPFVEPGAEMDLGCFLCKGAKKTPEGQNCPLCKASGWIEMLGAGMVHPQVLRNVGYDAEKYTGFAFGMGIERIVMTQSQVRDIRSFLESDLRFLEQFS